MLILILIRSSYRRHLRNSKIRNKKIYRAGQIIYVYKFILHVVTVVCIHNQRILFHGLKSTVIVMFFSLCIMHSRHSILRQPVFSVSVLEELIGISDYQIRNIQTSESNNRKLNVASTVSRRLAVAVLKVVCEKFQQRFKIVRSGLLNAKHYLKRVSAVELPPSQA